MTVLSIFSNDDNIANWGDKGNSSGTWLQSYSLTQAANCGGGGTHWAFFIVFGI